MLFCTVISTLKELALTGGCGSQNASCTFKLCAVSLKGTCHTRPKYQGFRAMVYVPHADVFNKQTG
jgi:hypothetical protein